MGPIASVVLPKSLTPEQLLEIEETIMKVAGEVLRPFSYSAQVKCRLYSHHLQRVIVYLTDKTI